MTVSTANEWARPTVFSGNKVRQLLVPVCNQMTIHDGELLEVAGPYGSWPAHRGPLAGSDGPLTAVLPVIKQSRIRLGWAGNRALTAPSDVLASYQGSIGFRPHEDPHSLRRPQIAALHSIVGYQSSGLTDPALVIMPTGTGKTETMLAWMVAARPEKLLVVVPTTALRNQIAEKFETLGILQRERIVAHTALRPCVGRLEHGFSDPDDARGFLAASNVVVATPNSILACDAESKSILLDSCTHLVVDEAHHAPAPMWSSVIRAFADRPVLLFTATPFRTDGRSLPGRTIFRFPLREAQREKYFSKIDFTSIVALEDSDEELARAAIARLKKDLDKGLDHILLARVKTQAQAEVVHAIYSRLGPQYTPRLVHDRVAPQKTKEALAALRAGASRIVVCVNMLGEGYDLPTLKIAAIHETHKSLSPTIQLIGRIARTESPTPVGTASVFVSQDPEAALSPLRTLLREDPDWDKVLSNITDRAAERAVEISEFDAAFTLTPSQVPVGLLEPKMSAIAFRTDASDWEPDNAAIMYGEDILDGVVSVSSRDDVAWFILEAQGDLRWGDVPGLQPVSYTLVIMYFDRDNGLLFIHGSDTKKKYIKLAEAVLDQAPDQIRGLDPFRVFARLDRLIPTNMGLLDARDRDKRFSMFVGSDIGFALSEAEREHKTNTHVAARAFDDGERVTIAAALSGRFWSMQTATGLSEWRDWCKRQASKLIDKSVDVRTLFGDMIIPVDVKERPPWPLLALEWPWELYLGTGAAQRARFKDATYLLTDVGFQVDDYSDTGPFRFSVVSPEWTVPYTATVGDTGLHYQAVHDDVDVISRGGKLKPLSEWFNDNKPTLFLGSDRLITGDDRLLEPRTDIAPYDKDKFTVIDWGTTNIRVESQGVDRRQDSIQAHMSRYLQQSQQFDVLIDDDRAGEAADLVGLRIDRDQLLVTLVHCKYSSEDTAGGRLKDIYEVCGQAIRGARWRNQCAEPLLKHLDRRTQDYYRTHRKQPYEVGDRAVLLSLRERALLLRPRFVTIVAQPGLSKKKTSDEQLRVIAAAASYVQAVTKGAFVVMCSE
ncbi:hypothetical protein MYCSP_09985 [Mycobacteroides saopaulense]|uniref:DEAD/DEAH box helicase n=1 Tax=Mycobacteroides saopaulense TaxID=1578165 RepID=UPI0007215A12|nr:DEAD/DEAH box helicase family protein [Mycobacteroides saopaulense]ALR11736.1 hypothetical protein MYCSP_09985 [Mycobacteroides saopaulense]